MLEIEAFLQLPGPLYDIRSPGEFSQGTIPGAINLPLFTNEERAKVGTVYKKEGQQKAVLLGLEFVGPKMRSFVEIALQNDNKEAPRLFCWRGGMRSQSMGWLFSQSGLKALLLKGGYKAFRSYALKVLEENYTLNVLGGMTGAGKTSILRSLKEEGKQVIDLEGLAHHKGSAFGELEGKTQPTNEAFENSIAFELSKMRILEPIWIEDESRMIGSCKIPDPLFQQMQKSSFYRVETPKEERLQFLIEDYGKRPASKLKEAVLCIKKKLGGERTQKILQHLEDENLKEAASLLLEYYDQAYMYSIERRQRTPLIYEKTAVH